MILTNEDLLAISQVVDTRLDIRLKPIEEDICVLKEDVKSIQADIDTMKSDIDTMKVDIVTMKSDIVTMQTDIDTMKSDIDTMKIDIEFLKTDVKTMQIDIDYMQNDIESLKTGLHSVNLFQENIILPRLNTIESCYLDTYNRYQKNSDKMEAVYDDVSLLKRVVTDHSEKLQKLA